jgi:hypothetical protein
MRSGDIFNEVASRPYGKTDYGQPLCTYYLEAMKLSAAVHDKVLVISSDLGNPCVQKCIDAGAIWKASTFDTDFAHLLWAKWLALSRSSLTHAAMYLSPVVKNWYFFGEFWIKDCVPNKVGFNFQAFGAHWNCFPSDNYTSEVVLRFRRMSEDHLNRLKTENCTWKFVTHFNQYGYETVTNE